MSEHKCHAIGCETPCKPEMLMCKRHWTMLPNPRKRSVLREYKAGQCNLNPIPSEQWHDAADAAIYWIKIAELRITIQTQAKENALLRKGMKGDYDLDAWLEWTKEVPVLEAKIEDQAKRIEALEAGIKKVMHEGVQDCSSKNDKCPHGKYGFEGCENCIDEYLQELLQTKQGRE